MDLDFLAKEWAAFEAAPVIFVAEAIVVGWFVWWLRGSVAQSSVDGLKEQLSAKDERLKLAHEKNDSARQEFQDLKVEMDRRELLYGIRTKRREDISSPIVPSAPTLDEHSLSTSVHSANLDRLLTDVSTATGVSRPENSKGFYGTTSWKIPPKSKR
jgi:hypothetical protein